MDIDKKPTEDALLETHKPPKQEPDETEPKRKRLSGAQRKRMKREKRLYGNVSYANVNSRGFISSGADRPLPAGADSTTSATITKIRLNEEHLYSQPTKKSRLHLGQVPPNKIISGEVKNRHVAIVDLQNPFGKINQVQADQIRTNMIEALDSYIISADDDQQIPTFRGWQYVGEVLRIICEDDESLKWLEKTVAKLPILWEGARLKIIQVDRLVKKVLWIPGKHESTEVVIRRLTSQNSWAGIKNWCLFRNIEKEEPLGTVLIFGLSKETDAVLKSKDYKLHYQFSTLTLKNIGDVCSKADQLKSTGQCKSSNAPSSSQQ